MAVAIAAMGRMLRSCFLVLGFLSCRLRFAMPFHVRAKAEKPFIEANCFPPLRHMAQVKGSGTELPILFYPVSKRRGYNAKYMVSWSHNDFFAFRSSNPWPDMNLSSDHWSLGHWDGNRCRYGEDGPRKLIQELGEGGECLLVRACRNPRGNRLLKVAVRARLTRLTREKTWWMTSKRVRLLQITNPKDFCAGSPWLLAEVEDLVDTDNDQDFREEELQLQKLIQKATDLNLYICVLRCLA